MNGWHHLSGFSIWRFASEPDKRHIRKRKELRFNDIASAHSSCGLLWSARLGNGDRNVVVASGAMWKKQVTGASRKNGAQDEVPGCAKALLEAHNAHELPRRGQWKEAWGDRDVVTQVLIDGLLKTGQKASSSTSLNS
ncbi:uncharacterized protein LOC144306474 isoform X2 [Canis aureus]